MAKNSGMIATAWQTCEHPATLLNRLLHWNELSERQGQPTVNFNERNRRLFVCGCISEIGKRIVLAGPGYTGKSITAIRYHADGGDIPGGLVSYHLELQEVLRRYYNDRSDSPQRWLLDLLVAATDQDSNIAVEMLVRESQHDDWLPMAIRADILRDVLGNPLIKNSLYQPGCELEQAPAWLQQTISTNARQMYQLGNRWHEVGVLADMMEDAGCYSETAISHLHNGKIHVRGCWVIDLLLLVTPGGSITTQAPATPVSQATL